MAEQQRSEIAAYWLGAPLPNWSRPCRVTATFEDHSGGGHTDYQFATGLLGNPQVINWKMSVRGKSVKVICDAVLPHEITHTIIACEFRRPVSRWYDEGIASYNETVFERSKLYDVARNGEWDFNHILGITEYPKDRDELLKIYGVGLATVEVLMNRGDQEDLIRCGHIGLQTNWGKAIQEVYGATLDEIESDVRGFREHEAKRLQYDLRVGTMYFAEFCAPCEDAKIALKTERFKRLGFTWDYKPITELPPLPGNTLVYAPDFVIDEDRYLSTHDAYGREDLFQWVQGHSKKVSPSGRGTRSTAPTPVPDPGFSGQQQQPQPQSQVAPSEPLIDIDWSQLRFVGVTNGNAGFGGSLLAGTVKRAIETVSGGQATLEIVNRAEEPERYHAVMNSVEIPPDVDAWGLVLVGEIIDVGLLKNVILKRVENEVLSRVNTESLPVPIEPILQRTNGRDYAALQEALGVKKLPEKAAETVVYRDREPTEDEKNTHGIVAVLFGFMAVTVGRRLFRFLASYVHHADTQENLDRHDAAVSQEARQQNIRPQPQQQPSVSQRHQGAFE